MVREDFSFDIQGTPGPRVCHNVEFQAKVLEQRGASADKCTEFTALVRYKSPIQGRATIAVHRLVTRKGKVMPSRAASTYVVNDCFKVCSFQHFKVHEQIAAHFESYVGNRAKKTTHLATVLTVRAWPKMKQDAVEALWNNLNDAARQFSGTANKDALLKSERATTVHDPRHINNRSPTKRPRASGVIDMQVREKERRRFSNLLQKSAERRQSMATQAPSLTVVMPRGQGRRMQAAIRRDATQDTPVFGSSKYTSTLQNSQYTRLVGAPHQPVNLSAKRSIVKSMKVRGQPSVPKSTARGAQISHAQARKPAHSLGKRARDDDVSSPKKQKASIKDVPAHVSSTEGSKEAHGPGHKRPVLPEKPPHQPTQPIPFHDKGHGLSNGNAPSGSASGSPTVEAPSTPSVLPTKKARRSGIANAGNTCYLAASVQVFLNDEAFIKLLRKQLAARQTCPASFSRALLALADEQKDDGALEPAQLRSAIARHFPEFGSSEQQDVHEFSTRALDVIEKELGGRPSECPVTQTYSLVEEKMFQCSSCGFSSVPRHELFRNLSLDIPSCEGTEPDRPSQQVSSEGSCKNLADLIHNYFQPEHVDLTCSHCDKGQKATCFSRVVVAPRVLALHLKRFRVRSDGVRGFSLEKVSDMVTLPEELHVQGELVTPVGDRGQLADAKELSTASTVTGSSGGEGLASGAADAVSSTRAQEVNFSGKTRIEAFRGSEGSTLGSPVSASTECASVSPGHEPQCCEARHHVSGEAVVGGSAGTRATGRCTVSSHNEGLVNSPIKEDSPASACPESLVHADRTRPEVLAAEVPLGQATVRNAGSTAAEELLCQVKHIRTGSQHCAESKTDAVRYRLYSVIRHCSSAASSGHYVVDVLQGDGRWLCYDDSSVRELDLPEARSRDGYLVFYMRQ